MKLKMGVGKAKNLSLNLKTIETNLFALFFPGEM